MRGAGNKEYQLQSLCYQAVGSHFTHLQDEGSTFQLCTHAEWFSDEKINAAVPCKNIINALIKHLSSRCPEHSVQFSLLHYFPLFSH